jgi:hypothetical protein
VCRKALLAATQRSAVGTRSDLTENLVFIFISSIYLQANVIKYAGSKGANMH